MLQKLPDDGDVGFRRDGLATGAPTRSTVLEDGVER